MPRRAELALRGAAAGTALLILTWLLSFHFGPAKHADQALFAAFGGLSVHPHVSSVANFFAGLCNPNPYLYLAAVPVVVALLRRRGWLAISISVMLFGANLSTQLLKPLLAHPRAASVLGGTTPVGPASWPSGHATAAMSLALCCVLAAPARFRPWVAAAGAAFAVAVSYSFLALGWHFPSDVFGGYLVAAIWTLLGIAGVYIVGGRHAASQTQEREDSVAHALAPAGVMLAGALLVVALVVLVRPHQVSAYVRSHHVFVLGAAAIAGAALLLAVGLMLALRVGAGPGGASADRAVAGQSDAR